MRLLHWWSFQGSSGLKYAKCVVLRMRWRAERDRYSGIIAARRDVGRHESQEAASQELRKLSASASLFETKSIGGSVSGSWELLAHSQCPSGELLNHWYLKMKTLVALSLSSIMVSPAFTLLLFCTLLYKPPNSLFSLSYLEKHRMVLLSDPAHRPYLFRNLWLHWIFKWLDNLLCYWLFQFLPLLN